MSSGELEVFLDTGWLNDATLYYKGYIYWCEGYVLKHEEGFEYIVSRWRAESEDDCTFRSFCDADNRLIEFSIVYNNKQILLENLQKDFLSAKIFSGKSFWEIEHQVQWLDENPVPIRVQPDNDMK